MKSFENIVLCPDCEIPYEENDGGALVCPECGREETASEKEARLVEMAQRKIVEEGTSYRERSEFEKHAKEYDEHSFEIPEKVKFKAGEFDETATSAESSALLSQIKKKQDKARAEEDEKSLRELILEEEKIQHEHDRHLAHEARERAKAQKLEEQMPFELLIDNGFVKMKFGRYPQSVVSDERMIAILDEKLKGREFVRNERGWFKFGNIMYSTIPAFPYDYECTFENGNKIETGKYYYFRVEPILWRVLDVRDDEAILLSDKVLTVKDFNADKRNGKWSDSYIRDWLNVRFSARAFTSDEQKWLKHDRLDNKTTAHKSTKRYVGEDTEDSVFLLSHAEAVRRLMGFSIVSDKKDPERRAHSSDYAKAMGAFCSHEEDFLDCSNWWLRSPGTTERSASAVEPTGKINLMYGVPQKMGVRMAIRIKPNPKKTED